MVQFSNVADWVMWSSQLQNSWPETPEIESQGFLVSLKAVCDFIHSSICDYIGMLSPPMIKLRQSLEACGEHTQSLLRLRVWLSLRCLAQKVVLLTSMQHPVSVSARVLCKSVRRLDGGNCLATIHVRHWVKAPPMLSSSVCTLCALHWDRSAAPPSCHLITKLGMNHHIFFQHLYIQYYVTCVYVLY